MCYQRDISRQFAFIQKRWANDPDFPHPGTGIDSIIGQPPKKSQQTWPSDWGQEPSVHFRFDDVVKLRGGEFFFTPSLPFLANAEENVKAGGASFKDDDDGEEGGNHEGDFLAEDSVEEDPEEDTEE